MFTCPICNHRGEILPQLPLSKKKATEFHSLTNVIGLDGYYDDCPSCGSSEAERNFALIISDILNKNAPKNILAINFSTRLKELLNKRQEQGKFNITHLETYDELLEVSIQFNVIFVFNTLAFVQNPNEYIQSIYSIADNSAILCLHSPFSTTLSFPFEKKIPVSSGFSKIFYGDDKALRLLGSDLTHMLTSCGFVASNNFSLNTGVIDAACVHSTLAQSIFILEK